MIYRSLEIQNKTYLTSEPVGPRVGTIAHSMSDFAAVIARNYGPIRIFHPLLRAVLRSVTKFIAIGASVC